ncbi:outer membrane beta-barrel protein [Sphingobacterium bambusae]|uniref:Outer membrane beta-barrel protein n=1 Tax=Sphingobacterium bambusae TaxID=662858 RepID=A0ABW6BF50_9SPHI|nr:outer membrane beta-barrel protein [Sphingobacterium bambusae]WPL50338.1 outer membrane beta-barrel protein [Sphingobacterium bambusae]
MKKLTALCAFLILTVFFVAQGQTKITGEVVDDADQITKLSNASVMLIRAKDSILVQHTRADQNGKFSLLRPDTIPYLLIVTYPKYGDFYKEIVQESDGAVGRIGLSSVSQLLEEVIVTGKIPVVIKGDTTEYDASSFAVEKNAKVEDLLKVLPGISVDASGKITAQGKTVEKVLVDGEEFFGNDPTLVTRNVRSDMVDKVQLFEKKSEEAERTGVDDGQRIQTINLKLKEDAKKGMFGKAEGGGGADTDRGFYTGTLAFNKFNGTQKIGVFGLTSNDGTVSLNWEDRDRFGFSDISSEISDDGSVSFSWRGDNMDYWNGRGRPRAISTGLSFADSWKEAKHKLNTSYKFGIIENEEESTRTSQENLVDAVLNSSDSSASNARNQKHRLNARYDLKIDSLTTLTMSIGASKGNTESSRTQRTNTFDGNGNAINDNIASQEMQSDNQSIDYSAYLTRKLKKEGRSISLRINGNHNETNGEGWLNSEANFYSSNTVSIIDQRKTMESRGDNFRSSLAYTEPLTKRLSSSLQYEFSHGVSSSISNSFNRSGDNGPYDVLDDEFSNDFDFNTTRHAANLSFNYRSDLIDANLTNNVRNDELYQVNNYEEMDLGRSFLTYNPSLYFRYKITKAKSVSFRFNRNNSLPSLMQIQPLRQNTDQLNIVVGNENLRPAQSNSYNLSFDTYNMMKNQYGYISLNWSQRFNNIQQNILIEEGRRTLSYANLDRVANTVSLWSSIGRDLLKKQKVRGNIGLDGTYNNYFNYINGALSENDNIDMSVSLNFSRNVKKGLDFYIGFTPGYSLLRNSLQPDLNSNGFVYRSNANLEYYLPWKVKIYSNINYLYQAPTKVFSESLQRFLWQPGVTKKFLKDESLTLNFFINDALNQNIGFNRQQSASTLIQDQYNTIARYYMLKVSWDFTSMKGGKE